MTGNSRKVVVLQDRDRKLLAELAVMRVIDRELTKAVAGFGSTTRANARLLSLTQGGYLRRDFVGTISGGRKAVYWLSSKGRAIGSAAAEGLQSLAGKGSRSDLFIEHQLKINEVYVWVKHQSILHASYRFKRWINFTRSLSNASPIIPDGYFELRHESILKAHFLEVDLGTEALRIWQKKIEGYLNFAVSGEFNKFSGQVQFKVLVIANSQRRAENIRNLTAKITDKIFRFSSFSIINREGFWSSIWQRPVGDQLESLV